MESVLTTAGFEHGHWGILVVDRKTRETIYERNADLLFAPASVAKLFSTAAALVELGPNFRFQTPLLGGDVDANGILHGDLILLAQGDLAMGGRTGPEGKLVFHDDDHTYAEGNFRSQTVPTDPLAGLDHICARGSGCGNSRSDWPGDHRRSIVCRGRGDWQRPKKSEPDRDQRQRDRHTGPACR